MKYGDAAFREFIARNGRNSTSRLPLARLVAGNVAKGEPPLPDADIAMETLVMIVTGTDTTGIALTFLFFELARHRAWYARLRDEVCAAVAHSTGISAGGTGDGDASDDASDDSRLHETAKVGHAGTQRQKRQQKRQQKQQQQQQQRQLSYAALQGLPILNAVVWETLRMYPSVPTALQRQVPRGGAPVTGAGTWLPEGTIVAAPVYTVQRNADAFPQPDEWRPERWLAHASSPQVPLPFLSPSPTLLTSSTSLATATGAADTSARQTAAVAKQATNADLPAGTAAQNADFASNGAGARAAPNAGNSGAAAAASHGQQYAIYEDAAMRAHMQAFSRGVRACLGKNIALAEMKLATAMLARRFATVRLADERQTVSDMRITDRFVLVPKGKRCDLVFE
jgi:cytochrome P450